MKRTEKQKIRDYFKRQGFTMSPVLLHKSVLPYHYKTTNGDHALIDSLHCSLFDGIDTPTGGIGCVVFAYYGKFRRKYCHSSDRTTIIKQAKVYNTAVDAIAGYKRWIRDANTQIENWQLVL